MLQLVELNLSEICARALDLNSGREAYLGQSFAYEMEALRSTSLKQHLNLDQLLTRSLLYGFSTHPVKRKVIVWFSLRGDFAILNFSDHQARLTPSWALEMPGYFESGRERVDTAARPYVYWDGNNFHRLYSSAVVDGSEENLVCDFGSYFGWTIGEADPEIAQLVRENDPDYWDYSFVPSLPEEIITIADKRCVLLHSRFNSTGTI